MAVPGRPGADLVLVQPDLALGRFEAGFNGPPSSGDIHQGADRRGLGGEGQVVRELVRLGEGATDQQASVPSRLKRGILPVGPVVQAWSLAAIAGAQPLPVPGYNVPS